MEPATRIDISNIDHHLWNNNGTWWVHYTIYPNTFQKERIRASLKTKDIKLARARRDRLFKKLGVISANGTNGANGAN